MATTVAPIALDHDQLSKFSKSPSGFIFFNHDLGVAGWEDFVLAFLVLALTVTAGEAFPLLISMFFKKIMKIHESCHEIYALLGLLVIGESYTIEEAKTLLKSYNTFELCDVSQIDHYAEKLRAYLLRPKSYRRGFYRTNFFELLYFIIKMLIYFFGVAIAFYLIKYDYIVWLTGIGLSSVIVLYGFMSYIVGMIDHVVLLYSDRVRVGSFIEIPGRGKVGCILELNTFSVKFAVLNTDILARLPNLPKSVVKTNQPRKLPISIDTRYHDMVYSGEPGGHHRTNLVPEGGGVAVGAPVFIPLPMPLSMTNVVTQAPTSNRSTLGLDPNTNTRSTQTDHSDHATLLFQRLVSYGFLPNGNLIHNYYEEP